MRHPGQLEIDFSIPAKDPLKVAEIADAMSISTSKIYAAIERGDLEATMVGRERAERQDYIVPLKNYIAWLNNEHPRELYFRFPSKNMLSVEDVRFAMGAKSHQHVRNLIDDGEFPNVQNHGRSGKQKHLKIPLVDFVAFINRRRVGDYC